MVLFLSHVRPGSAVLEFEPGPFQADLEGASAGAEILREWVEGVRHLSDPGSESPESFDRGVLAGASMLRPLLDRGLERIEFTWKRAAQSIQVSYDRSLSRRIETLLERPTTNRQSFSGIVLEADFHAPEVKFTLYTEKGEPLTCTAPEEDLGVVLGSLMHFARVTGDAIQDPESGRVRLLRADNIEIGIGTGIEDLPIGSIREFWSGVELGTLMERQNVRPYDPMEVRSWEVPPEQDVERFLRVIEKRENGEEHQPE